MNKIDTRKKIKFFSNCIPVYGYKNVIVCDLQRCDYYEIDRNLCDIIVKNATLSIGEIIEKTGTEYEKEILEAINLLMDNQLIQLVDSTDEFPEISLNYECPSIIDNMIIEAGEYFNKNVPSFIEKINSLSVKYIELRVFKNFDLSKIESFLDSLSDTKVRGVYLMIPNISMSRVQHLLNAYQRIQQLILYDYQEKNNPPRIIDDRLILSSVKDIDSNCCGLIGTFNFCCNIKAFTEAKNFNSCLNRKISVAKDGQIVLCPSIKGNYGEFLSTSIPQLVKNKQIQKYWGIKKDQIDTCKDCEFRYICTDCRAFIENPENLYSKPLKCSYNPYEGKWS